MLTYFKQDGMLLVEEKILGAIDDCTRVFKCTKEDGTNTAHESHQELIKQLDENHILVFGDTSIRGNGFFPKTEAYKDRRPCN
jgi:hypothetical protein